MARTLPERLLELAQIAPDRELIRTVYPDQPDIVLSRAGFFQAALAASAFLGEAGVTTGDLVIIVQRDSLLLTATFFGAALLGAIPSIMPFQTEKLQPERYQASMAVLIDLAEPKALATETDLEGQVRDILPDNGHNPAVVSIPKEALLTGQAYLSLPGRYEPEAIALLQHSSGTTGLQKGVALSHRAIFEQLDRYGASIGFSQDDVVVSWLPLYHDMGLIAGFLQPILGGARLVLMSPLDWVRAPAMLMQQISTHGGTLCWLPNFAYNFSAQKIRESDLDGVDLRSIRAFVNCSEPVYASSHQEFVKRFTPYGVMPDQLTTCYAMAETVFAVSQSELGQPARIDWVDRARLHAERVARPTPDSGQPIVSSGRTIEGMQVRVLDEAFQALPERHVGQISLHTSHMLNGYHRRADATEAAFHDGWYLTGDMGYLAEGEVFVLGRKKDLIIVGGRNIYPRDLETIVNTVSGVYPGRAVAFGIPNPVRGTEDIAIVAEMADGALSVEQRSQVGADIRRAIAAGTDLMVRHVELVPRNWLIKTSSGKVARAANREKFLQAHPEIESPL
jgi:fatty-acyl-CoA synthase